MINNKPKPAAQVTRKGSLKPHSKTTKNAHSSTVGSTAQMRAMQKYVDIKKQQIAKQESQRAVIKKKSATKLVLSGDKETSVHSPIEKSVVSSFPLSTRNAIQAKVNSQLMKVHAQKPKMAKNAATASNLQSSPYGGGGNEYSSSLNRADAGVMPQMKKMLSHESG